MNSRRLSVVVLSVVLFFTLLGRLEAAEAAKTEIKGAAILEHPCGKVAVKHMGLIHAGKIDEALKLGSKEMQEQWKATPADERKMMFEIMKEMSKPEAEFTAEIKSAGLLAIEGDKAKLTVTHEHKSAEHTGTQTLTQRYVLDGAACLVSPR